MKLFTLLSIATIAAATSKVDESGFAPADVIEKDVAIIGGGAGGTYAAVRLREDLDKSIVLIEKESVLGGHTNTWNDPDGDLYINYGVLAYLRYGGAAAFFKRFNIPIAPYIPAQGPVAYVNAADGTNLSSFVPPSFNATVAAIQKWVDLVEKYDEELLPGLFNFWDGKDIPSDLLMPFGEFATKHGLEAAYPTMAVVSNVGVGGVRDILTLYVYFAFGTPVAREFLQGSLFIPDGVSNGELYNRALKLLRDDVMLRSHVVASERNKQGVKLIVQNANGHKKLVKAKRLLFTPAPSLKNLGPFDPDQKEAKPLSTFSGTWSFTSVCRVPSVPINYTVNYYSKASVPTDYLDIREWPYTLTVESQFVPGDDLFRVLLASDYPMSHATAKSIIADGIKNLTDVGTFDESADTSTEFLAFVDHNSILWRQSKAQLRAGIVQDVYALQGYRSTWYSSGVLSQDYTSNVWQFVDVLLPKMLAGL